MENIGDLFTSTLISGNTAVSGVYHTHMLQKNYVMITMSLCVCICVCFCFHL